jgi:hypothetical protein
MENYYKILGLKVGASLDELEEKYNKLLKEFDPEKQTDELKEFFTSESEKVKEAYKEITASLMNTESVEKVDFENSDDFTHESYEEQLNESLAEEVLSDEVIVDNNLNDQINNNKKENYVFRNVLLFFIAAGVWGMFMQNMGFFMPSDDDYTQKVRVVNTVDTEVQGSVSVNGSVSVDNTVDINIEQINGYSNVFYKQDGKYFLLPTYNPYQ